MSAARRTRLSDGRPVRASEAWSAGAGSAERRLLAGGRGAGATFGRVAVIGGLAYWRSDDGAKDA